jgi:hypothetical protein
MILFRAGIEFLDRGGASPVESLIGLVVMLGGPAVYGWLQLRAIRRAQGLLGWCAAMLPAALVAAATVWTAFGLATDQNLAPLVLVLSFPIAVLWLAAGEAGRKIQHG